MESSRVHGESRMSESVPRNYNKQKCRSGRQRKTLQNHITKLMRGYIRNTEKIEVRLTDSVKPNWIPSNENLNGQAAELKYLAYNQYSTS